MITDYLYRNILQTVNECGDEITTRNAITKSCCDLDPLTFTQTPLVTLRKTAWKMALREMEWFMSGDTKCPDELLPWWKDQLGYGGMYRGGYSHQYRRSGYSGTFDQIQYLLNGMRNNPNSRRLVMTTWNPSDMAYITELNHNALTPSCCHGSLVQLFVREGRVHMTHYQRSADLILGFPHNILQYWALLLYLSHHAGLKIGTMRHIIGDAHLYCDKSHDDVVKAIIGCDLSTRLASCPELVYNGGSGCEFRASDFEMIGEIQEPVTMIRPKLF